MLALSTVFMMSQRWSVLQAPVQSTWVFTPVSRFR